MFSETALKTWIPSTLPDVNQWCICRLVWSKYYFDSKRASWINRWLTNILHQKVIDEFCDARRQRPICSKNMSSKMIWPAWYSWWGTGDTPANQTSQKIEMRAFSLENELYVLLDGERNSEKVNTRKLTRNPTWWDPQAQMREERSEPLKLPMINHDQIIANRLNHACCQWSLAILKSIRPTSMHYSIPRHIPRITSLQNQASIIPSLRASAALIEYTSQDYRLHALTVIITSRYQSWCYNNIHTQDMWKQFPHDMYFDVCMSCSAAEQGLIRMQQQRKLCLS